MLKLFAAAALAALWLVPVTVAQAQYRNEEQQMRRDRDDGPRMRRDRDNREDRENREWRERQRDRDRDRRDDCVILVKGNCIR